MFSTWLATWKQTVDAGSVVVKREYLNVQIAVYACRGVLRNTCSKRHTGRKSSVQQFTSETLIACTLAGSNREAAWGCLIG